MAYAEKHSAPGGQFTGKAMISAPSKASVRASGSRIGRAPMLFPTPRIESIDIDTEEDWALAEVVARGLGDRP